MSSRRGGHADADTLDDSTAWFPFGSQRVRRDSLIRTRTRRAGLQSESTSNIDMAVLARNAHAAVYSRLSTRTALQTSNSFQNSERLGIEAYLQV